MAQHDGSRSPPEVDLLKRIPVADHGLPIYFWILPCGLRSPPIRNLTWKSLAAGIQTSEKTARTGSFVNIFSILKQLLSAIRCRKPYIKLLRQSAAQGPPRPCCSLRGRWRVPRPQRFPLARRPGFAITALYPQYNPHTYITLYSAHI